MESSLLNNVTVDCTKESFFNIISPQIFKLRQQFHKFAWKQSPELAKTIINHYNERLVRAGSTLMIGEYVPFILGDLFSISMASIQKVAFPWFLMYQYSLLIDDLLDQTRKNWKLELLSSQVLLDASFKEFSNNNNNEIFSLFEKYRNESVNGMICEFNHSKNDAINPTKETVSHLIMQGRKAALAKFCVTYMISIDKHREIKKNEERILDNICAGVQLLDDLTDYSEDYYENRINITLSIMYKWFKINHPTLNSKKLNHKQLVAGIIVSKSLENTLDFSHSLLKSVNDLYKNTSLGYNAIGYFNELASECHQKKRFIGQIVSNNSSQIELYNSYLFNNHNKIGKIESTEKLFKKIIALSPKLSN